MKKWTTTQDFIDNGKLNGAPVGTVIETDGFFTVGDGGGADWIKTNETGTPSQTPSDLGDVKLTDSGGNVWEYVVKGKVIKPLGLGAGFGNDDGAVLNACFQWLRDQIAAKQDSASIDGEDATYNTSISVNGTHLSNWNYKIKNMTVVGTCTGVGALDFTGSRGGNMSNVTVYGEESSMPARGIQFARSAAEGFGFCDNWKLENVTTIGYFSVAGFYGYAQETTHYDHCRFWNYNHAARAAIHAGNDSVEPYSSVYVTPVTGSHSFINNKYTNMDYRYLPAGKTFAIASITKANPAVVTTTLPHSFETGDKVSTIFIEGMTEIDNRSLTITKISDTQFSFDGVDSTAYGTFTSGNAVKSQLKPSVLLARAEQHTFDTCYIVAYGAPHLEIAFVDGKPLDQIKLDVLFEGGGMLSHVRFTGVDAFESTVNGFELETYNTHSGLALLSTDATSSVVTLNNGFIKINTESKANLIVAASAARFSLKAVDVKIPDINSTDFGLFDYYSGRVSDDTGYIVDYKVVASIPVTQNYTPTITPVAGAFGSITVSKAQYTINGGLVNFDIVFRITDIGTATSAIRFNVPLPGLSSSQLALGAELTNGYSLIVRQILDNETMEMMKYDGTKTFATGDFITITGCYQL